MQKRSEMQYVIEYFDDFAPHHRIVKKLKKSEVSEWVNEYGQLKYIPRSTKNFNALYKVGGERVRAEDFGNGSGFDTLSTRHDGEDAKIRRVGTEQGGERHSKGDDSGNGKSVNDNRQGRNGSSVSSGTEQKFSTVNSEGEPLSQGQAEFFKDSKVRDENGRLKVVPRVYSGIQRKERRCCS